MTTKISNFIYLSILGEYQVLCKGAESSVLQKCVGGPIDETIEHVDYYAGVCLSFPLVQKVSG